MSLLAAKLLLCLQNQLKTINSISKVRLERVGYTESRKYISGHLNCNAIMRSANTKSHSINQELARMMYLCARVRLAHSQVWVKNQVHALGRPSSLQIQLVELTIVPKHMCLCLCVYDCVHAKEDSKHTNTNVVHRLTQVAAQ